MSEALVRTYVGVLQVDQLQSGGIPIKLFTLSVGLQQLQLCYPVDPISAPHRIDFEIVEHRFPCSENVCGFRVRNLLALRGTQERTLDLERGGGASTDQPDSPCHGDVMGYGTHLDDGILDPEFPHPVEGRLQVRQGILQLVSRLVLPFTVLVAPAILQVMQLT